MLINIKIKQKKKIKKDLKKVINKNKSLTMLFFLSCYYQSFFINYFTVKADKSQRPVLGIADINEKVENDNLLASNVIENVKSPSNSISNCSSNK